MGIPGEGRVGSFKRVGTTILRTSNQVGIVRVSSDFGLKPFRPALPGVSQGITGHSLVVGD